MTSTFIAEIIAALLAGIAIGTYKNFLHPFIKEHFTDRIRLKNKWMAEVNFGSGFLHGIKLELNKLGNDISGNVEFVSGRHSGKIYPVRGYFRSDILTFTYSPSDLTSTSQGTATFKRLKDGELLKGYFAYYSQDSNSISTVECEFRPI